MSKKSPQKHQKQPAAPPEPKYKNLSFLTDFGHKDEFVGIVKSVVHSIAPHAHITDITHGIPPYNVRAAALTLARAAGYLCPGVVLAVVDPGVGSDRRMLAIEVGKGSSVLIGPDNGIFAPVSALVGGPERVFELTDTKYQLPAPGNSFAARDIMGPAAAHVMNGVDISELGPEVDMQSLVPMIIPVARKEGDAIYATALWVDGYGNMQLNLSPEEFAALQETVQIKFGDFLYRAKKVSSYSEIERDGFGIITDSYGMTAISRKEGSAAAAFQVREGDELSLLPVSASRPAAPEPVNVELKETR